MEHALGILNEEDISVQEDKSEISWTADTTTAADEVNWKAFAAELTWENMWTHREWKSIGKHFLFAFSTGFFFSAFDVFTDGWSGLNFIFGAYYVKNVPIPYDVSDSGNPLCKILHPENDTQSVEHIQYQCFERDPIWGAVTLVFMFIPGLSADNIWRGLDKQVDKRIFLILRWLSLPFFPVMLIGLKLIGLFIPGPEMSKVLAAVNYIEGTRESTLQFCLQLFIVMSRKDRMPSKLQWATICTSFLMINKAGVEAYLRHETPGKDIKARVKKTLSLLPMFMTANAFKLISGSLLAVTFTYWILLAYEAALLLWLSIKALSTREDREKALYFRAFRLHPIAIIRARPAWGKWSFTEKERMKQLLFGNVAWFLTTGIFLAIAMIVSLTRPNLSIPTIGFPNQNGTWNTWYKLSDRAIVSEAGPTMAFKILVPMLFACGLSSLGLIYRELLNSKETFDREEDNVNA